MKYEEPGSKYGWKPEYDYFFDGLDKFEYEPLKGKRSIRLLKLAPLPSDRRHPSRLMRNRYRALVNDVLYNKDRHSKFDWLKRPYKNASPDDSPFRPVEITLQEHTIDDAPNYAAISYTWGPIDNRALICNGRLMYVSRNAILALYHVALAHIRSKVQYVWIDQICIEQSHLEEKGEQVRIMGSIYSNATITFAWIGESTEAQEKTITETTNNRYDSLSESIYNLPWFSRAWIMQEMWFSKMMIVLCGSWTIPWSLLYLSFNFESTAEIIARLPKKDVPYLRFGAIMHLMLRTDVSDPLDRLYAFCGLSSELSELVGPPDYNADAQVLYKKFAQDLLRKDGPDGRWLWLLIRASAKGALNAPASPSWTPDITQVRTTISACNTLGELSVFSSPGYSSETWVDGVSSEKLLLSSQETTQLRCHYVEIGLVQERMGSTITELRQKFETNQVELSQKLKELFENVAYDEVYPSPNGSKSLDPILRRTFSAFSQPTLRSDIMDHAQAFIVHIGFKRAKPGVWAARTDHIIEAFAIADQGVRSGDRIVLFKGLSQAGPFSIVRPHEDGTWIYVGSCNMTKIDLEFLYPYVYGVHDEKELILS